MVKVEEFAAKTHFLHSVDDGQVEKLDSYLASDFDSCCCSSGDS